MSPSTHTPSSGSHTPAQPERLATTGDEPSPIAGSLLDDPALRAVGMHPASAKRAPKPFRVPSPPAWLQRLWQRPGARYGSLAAALLIASLVSFLALRPTPKPDFEDDPMDDVLNYTLLSEDFNSLSIDERMGLLKDLIARFNSMSGEDSEMMAIFASTVQGKLREQLERNATKLAMDLWDKYAFDYAHAPPDKRGEFLDDAFLNLTKSMEVLGGQQSTKTDKERLDEVKRQAKRDEAMFKDGKGPTAGQLARMSVGMRRAIEKNSAPQQQLRAQQLMRDMTDHFRKP